jgi:hypothetical protein
VHAVPNLAISLSHARRGHITEHVPIVDKTTPHSIFLSSPPPQDNAPARYLMDGCSIFHEELASRYPDHGHALWEPNPGGLHEAIEVGDIGFIDCGYFYHLFNALWPPPSNSDASNGLKYPSELKPRNPNHICKDKDNHQDFCLQNV